MKVAARRIAPLGSRPDLAGAAQRPPKVASGEVLAARKTRVARRERLAQVIKAGYERLDGCTGSTAEWTLEEFIGTGETTTVEFKCCLRKNLLNGRIGTKHMMYI